MGEEAPHLRSIPLHAWADKPRALQLFMTEKGWDIDGDGNAYSQIMARDVAITGERAAFSFELLLDASGGRPAGTRTPFAIGFRFGGDATPFRVADVKVERVAP